MQRAYLPGGSITIFSRYGCIMRWVEYNRMDTGRITALPGGSAIVTEIPVSKGDSSQYNARCHPAAAGDGNPPG